MWSMTFVTDDIWMNNFYIEQKDHSGWYVFAIEEKRFILDTILKTI